jgi:hypothetical protein
VARERPLLPLTERGRAEHIFRQPAPIVARIVWEHDGEEHVDTVALGWSRRDVYMRLPDPRYQFTAVCLDAAYVRRR